MEMKVKERRGMKYENSKHKVTRNRIMLNSMIFIPSYQRALGGSGDNDGCYFHSSTHFVVTSRSPSNLWSSLSSVHGINSISGHGNSSRGLVMF